VLIVFAYIRIDVTMERTRGLQTSSLVILITSDRL